MRFSVLAADIEELDEGVPAEVALENAVRKATAVAADRPGATVLGADTIVSASGRIYGKPADEQEARSTLRALSGRRHEVIGGICLIEDGRARTAVSVTEVQFRDLGETLIEWYLETGEWRERAGAYAIQGRGAALVTRIEGDYLNVVGLPVAAMVELAPWLVWG